MQENFEQLDGKNTRVLRFTDSGAVVNAGKECQAISVHEAVCKAELPASTVNGMHAFLTTSVQVELGDKDDELTSDRQLGTVDLGDGDDKATITASGSVRGGEGNDVIRVSGGADFGTTISGDAGDDELYGAGAGIEGRKFTGGPGNDKLNGSEGEDSLDGGPGDDEIHGNNGGDQITGGPGSDQLYGDSDDDFINAYDGETSVPDTIDGGEGQNSISYAESHSNLDINLQTNRVRDAAGVEDTLRSIQHVMSGSGDDVLTGDGNYNSLIGGLGNDKLVGGSGNDFLYGGNMSAPLQKQGHDDDTLIGEGGDDILEGAGGANKLYGGNGSDQMTSVGDGAPDTFDAGQGNDKISMYVAGEVAHCGPGNDSIEHSVKGAISDRDCEGIQLNSLLLFQLPVALRKKEVRIPVTCVRQMQHKRRCPMKISMRLGAVTIAAGHFSVRFGKHVLHVPVAAQRLAKLQSNTPVTVHVKLYNFAKKKSEIFAYTVTLNKE